MLAPVLPALAWRGRAALFLWLLAYALVSDAIDGWLSRKLNQSSDIGTKLDSWGDLALCFAVPLGIWLLWSDTVRREAIFVALVLVGYTAPTLVALAKYRRLPSYHTRIAKFAGVAMGLSVLVLLARGTAWPFRVSAILVVIEAIEEIAITAALPSWTSNVGGFWHALAIRRGEGT